MTSPSPVGRWWHTTYGAVAARITQPAVASRSVVLLVPALGYESSSSYRTLRAAAEALAVQGHVAVRLELPGTGDAAGATGPASLESLVGALVESVDAVRAAGAEQISLVGLRAGGSVALLAAARTPVDALALWASAGGRRFRRELSLIGTAIPPDSGMPEGSVVVGGWLFPGPLLDDLAALDPATATVVPDTHVLVLDREDRPSQDLLAETLRAGGATVWQRQAGQHDRFLDRPSEDSEVGVEAVAALADWFAAVVPTTASGTDLALPGSTSTDISWGTGSVTEDHVTLGSHGLAAVVTHGPTPSRDILLFLNSGSDPHHGPGRAWVEYARELALRGQDVARVDFRGWGDSPSAVGETGRPYDAHHGDDALSAAEALRDLGYDRVVLSGLCAGAWVSLDLARRAPVDAVLALNAQLYWAPGDPIDALMATTRERRLLEIAEIRRRADEGEWDRADLAGERPAAGVWLDELTSLGVPVSLVFAEGDDGIEYLQDRLGRRVADLQARGLLRIREVTGIDHQMGRIWRRPAMVDVLADEVAALLALAD
jgi:pimeloyl-ACP methyl ester carboxylesterase